MEKYFDENIFNGESLLNLHDFLAKATEVVSSNLFFHEAVDKLESREHRVMLAISAYKLIAVCEAVLDKVGDVERAEALEDVRDGIGNYNASGLLLELLKAMAGVE